MNVNGAGWTRAWIRLLNIWRKNCGITNFPWEARAPLMQLLITWSCQKISWNPSWVTRKTLLVSDLMRIQNLPPVWICCVKPSWAVSYLTMHLKNMQEGGPSNILNRLTSSVRWKMRVVKTLTGSGEVGSMERMPAIFRWIP